MKENDNDDDLQDNNENADIDWKFDAMEEWLLIWRAGMITLSLFKEGK